MATTNSRMSRFPTTVRNFSQEGRALTTARTSPPASPPLPGARRFTPSALRTDYTKIRPPSRPVSVMPRPTQAEEPPPTGAQWAGTGARTRAAAQGGTYYDPGSAWQTPLAGVRPRQFSDVSEEQQAYQDLEKQYEQRRQDQANVFGQQDESRRAFEAEQRARGGQTASPSQPSSAPLPGDRLAMGTTGAGLRGVPPAPSGPLTGPFRPTMMPSVQQDFMSAYSAARRRAAAEQAQMRDVESGGFREAGPKQAEAGGEQSPIITAEDLVPPEEYGPQGEAEAQSSIASTLGDFAGRLARNVDEAGGGDFLPQALMDMTSQPDYQGRDFYTAQAGGDPELAALYGSLFDLGVQVEADGTMSYQGREIGNITDDPSTWQGIAGREYGRFLQREQQQESDEFIARERARALPEVQQVDVEPMVAAQQEKRALDQARAMRAMLASGAASGLSPAAMTGTTAQMQQQANIEGQAVDAAMRWQAEVQNNQNAMAAWAAEVSRLNALMQTETDMRTRAFLAEESRRAIANQRAHEMELARLQNEITGSDLLGFGLTLLGTAAGGFAGAVGGKLAASWLDS